MTTITETKTVTYEDAVALIERAVAEKGKDFEYEQAKFTSDHDGHAFEDYAYFDGEGKPSCIVGHAFSYLGITSEDIGSHNTSTTARPACMFLEREHGFSFDEEAKGLFYKAQDRQDQGDQWSVALGMAIEYVGATREGGDI